MHSRDDHEAEPSTETSGTLPGDDPRGTASYIADLTTELAVLARKSRLNLLAHLLEIAQLEASISVRRGVTGAPPS